MCPSPHICSPDDLLLIVGFDGPVRVEFELGRSMSTAQRRNVKDKVRVLAPCQGVYNPENCPGLPLTSTHEHLLFV